MKISKKKQAIIDAFKTQKEKDDYIEVLVREFKEQNAKRYAKYHKENPEKVKERKAKYRAKKKAEKQLIESIIDGRKLAETLSYSEAYEWLINDNNGSYSEDKHQLGIVLVNNLRFMSEEYDNNAEYGIYEAWTKENIDAVCVMLDAMFEFCNKRQIKYINLN
jgi:hypothetical protein